MGPSFGDPSCDFQASSLHLAAFLVEEDPEARQVPSFRQDPSDPSTVDQDPCQGRWVRTWDPWDHQGPWGLDPLDLVPCEGPWDP